MPATVSVNMRTVVHAGSSGICMGFPDVCKTPAPPSPSPIPIPYPNIAQSSDTAQGSSTVKCDGNPVMVKDSNFSTSSGDEAGSIGGMMSNTTKGKAEFQMYSFDVKFDGKSVARLLDIMVLNKLSSPNTPPFPLMQPPAIVVDIPVPDTPGSEPSMSKFEQPDGEQKKVQ
jgi:hypothetical protein